MYRRGSRESRAYFVGKSADKIFERYGLSSDLASLAAFEAETFKPSQFIEQMTVRRVSRQISRSDLSSTLGYSLRSMEFWEAGKISPKLVVAENWAQALGLELSLKLVAANP